MRFLVITPVINANSMLMETFNSIVNQMSIGERFSITYIIADAGSTSNDDFSFVEEMLSGFKSVEGLDVIHVKYKDKSMYDGLVNAIKTELDNDYDYFSYINSGDYYSPYAFQSIVDNNSAGNNEAWITGCIGSYNEHGQLYKLIEPVAYPKSLILSGVFGRFLPYIQQESNFFKFDFLKKIDLEKLSNFKYAGDFYLWKSLGDLGFSPKISPIWLAGFREHDGQLSSVYDKEYKKEMLSVCDKVSVLSFFKSFVILSLYVIHPRLRPRAIVERVRKWK
ncbi:glycosyltransferase family protein [Photobacterium leiognathi]|uniref:hypothetical protein n=1 Tax=Photobacterium leiognathi TaxID=553611 RepID=UPI0029815444|nr:hypothetical protein [Photobacterium leiognathi]